MRCINLANIYCTSIQQHDFIGKCFNVRYMNLLPNKFNSLCKQNLRSHSVCSRQLLEFSFTSVITALLDNYCLDAHWTFSSFFLAAPTMTYIFMACIFLPSSSDVSLCKFFVDFTTFGISASRIWIFSSKFDHHTITFYARSSVVSNLFFVLLSRAKVAPMFSLAL